MVSMRELAQITVITTGLPPLLDGVGDYSYNLAQQIHNDFGIQTQFIIGNPYWKPILEKQDFQHQAQVLSRRSSRELLKSLGASSAVLLHYVGYGYAKRGCPIWLVKSLEKWRQGHPDRYLLTMFHEIYAYSPNMISSQFWTSPLQQYLAQRLVKLSDRCLTSKQDYAEIITRLSGGKHSQVVSLPVFSNVGEPAIEELPPLQERSHRLVVFGGKGTRARVYQRSLAILETTCQQLEIREIFDIGPSLSFELPRVNHLPIQALGVRHTQEVSQILRDTQVGFFDYSLAFLAKSTVFAAYCAHRVLPIGVDYSGPKSVDGLRAGQHYWLGNAHPDTMGLPDRQLVADQAYRWYQNHRLADQAKLFLTHLPSHVNSQ